MGATITPDGKKLVAVGQAEIALPADIANGIDGNTSTLTKTERRLQIYDLVKRREEAYVSIPLEMHNSDGILHDSFISQPREMTCVTVSADSRYALVSQAPNVGSLFVDILFTLTRL